MGKGDKYRPVDREKYDRNYDRIFGSVETGAQVTGSVTEEPRMTPSGPHEQEDDEC